MKKIIAVAVAVTIAIAMSISSPVAVKAETGTNSAALLAEFEAWRDQYDPAAVMEAIRSAIAAAENAGLVGPFLVLPANGNGIVELDPDISVFSASWQESGNRTPIGTFSGGWVVKAAGADRDTYLKVFTVNQVILVAEGHQVTVADDSRQDYLNMVSCRLVRTWLENRKRAKEPTRWFTTNVEPRDSSHEVTSVISFTDGSYVEECLRPDGQYTLTTKAKGATKKSGGSKPKPPADNPPATTTPPPTAVPVDPGRPPENTPPATNPPATNPPAATPVDPGRPPEDTPVATNPPAATPVVTPAPTNPLAALPVDPGRNPEPAKPAPTNPLAALPVDPGRNPEPASPQVALPNNPLSSVGTGADSTTSALSSNPLLSSTSGSSESSGAQASDAGRNPE